MLEELVAVGAFSVTGRACAFVAHVLCRRRPRDTRSLCAGLAFAGAVLALGTALLAVNFVFHRVNNIDARREIRRGKIVQHRVDRNGEHFEVEFPHAGPGETAWMRVSITPWRPMLWPGYVISLPFALIIGVGAWMSAGVATAQPD